MATNEELSSSHYRRAELLGDQRGQFLRVVTELHESTGLLTRLTYDMQNEEVRMRKKGFELLSDDQGRKMHEEWPDKGENDPEGITKISSRIIEHADTLQELMKQLLEVIRSGRRHSVFAPHTVELMNTLNRRRSVTGVNDLERTIKKRKSNETVNAEAAKRARVQLAAGEQKYKKTPKSSMSFKDCDWRSGSASDSEDAREHPKTISRRRPRIRSILFNDIAKDGHFRMTTSPSTQVSDLDEALLNWFPQSVGVPKCIVMDAAYRLS